MDSSSLGAIAIAIFLLSLWTLLAPMANISPWISAGLVTLITGVVALEQGLAKGRYSSALGALWKQQSPQFRDRILHHEAGHLLAACALDIPVTDYALDPWEALKKGYPGYGGVQLDDSVWQQWQESGEVKRSDVERYGVMWMAGPVAERSFYGQSMGADSDRQQLRSFVAWLNRCGGERLDPSVLERWCELRAKTLLNEREEAYQVAVSAMRDGLPMADCTAAIRASLGEAVTAS
ncbi:MAG: hypothetical protein AAFX40_00905 [Cyanobacteria bacterium J06639_1]